MNQAPRPPRSRRHLLRRFLATGTLSLVGALASPIALADVPARFMVPFPAGGAADAMARVLVEKLKEEMKQTIVVDNRPGASTRIAAELLKQAPADGNTVLMTLMDTMVIAPLVYSNLRYDPARDFAPITEIAEVTYGIAVRADQPYRNLGDYVQAAKADHAKATIGISGLGSALHFVSYEFSRKSGADMNIVPFHGGPAMVTSLIGGQIGAAVDGLGVFVKQHEAGKLRVLAVSGKRRVIQLPDVPTFQEQGFPSLVVGSYYALFAPAATPDAQVQRWNQAMRKVLALPEVRARIQAIGYQPGVGSSPAEVAQLRQRLLEHWQPIVKETNYKSD